MLVLGREPLSPVRAAGVPNPPDSSLQPLLLSLLLRPPLMQVSGRNLTFVPSQAGSINSVGNGTGMCRWDRDGEAKGIEA